MVADSPVLLPREWDTMKTRRERNAENKAIAFAWAAYMISHEPEEIAKLLKYKNPSDNLRVLADKKITFTLSDGKVINSCFPLSLASSAGVKLLYNAVVNVNAYIKDLPRHALTMLLAIKFDVKARREDTRLNIQIVAEAILHRVASEFKPEVLFAFDSINTWIKSAYGKELGYLTIRKALEALEQQGYLVVREWGKRGVRTRCTKIYMIFDGKPNVTLANVDDWLASVDHALMAVYSRESTTRQEVMAQKFYHYVEQLVETDPELSRYAQGARLFPASNDRLAVVGVLKDGAPCTKDIAHVHTSRFLGRLVPALQENGPHARPAFTGVFPCNDSIESQRGSP